MLDAQSVTLYRGARHVLADITLEIRAGEIVGIVGPNGAGKSSLVKVLSGSLAASSGQVLFLGRDLRDWPPAALARHRAVLSQSSSVSFPFSVAEIVELPLQDLSPARRQEISSQALAEVGLAGFAERLLQHLSGGEQQRVHLARVLSQLSAHRLQQLLFLDEPTSSLDVRHQIEVLTVVRRRISPDLGAVIVLHDLNLAAAFADRLLIMKDGRIARDGPTDQVMDAGLLSDIYGIPMTRTSEGRRILFFPEFGFTA
jgi:iron complex transport system ATP-binding protein